MGTPLWGPWPSGLGLRERRERRGPGPSARSPAPPAGAQEPGRSLLGAKKRTPPPRPPPLWLLLSSLCRSPAQSPAYSRRRINAGVICPFILCSIHSLIIPSFSFDSSHFLLPPHTLIHILWSRSLLPPSLPPSLLPISSLHASVSDFCRYLLCLSYCLSVSLSLPSCPCGSRLCLFISVSPVFLSLPFSSFPPHFTSRLLAHLHLDARAPPAGSILCPSAAPRPFQYLNFLSRPCLV